MELETMAVIVKTKDNYFYQVGLDNEQLVVVEEFIKMLQGGNIKVLPHKLEGIKITKKQPNESTT